MNTMPLTAVVSRRTAATAVAAATAGLAGCASVSADSLLPPRQQRRIDVGSGDSRATLAAEAAIDAHRGPTLLFLSGFTLEQSMWDAQFAALAPRHRVIRFDERGIGGSSRLQPGEKYRDADDIRAVLDAFGVERVHLVGHSRGVRRAIDFVLAAPDNRGRVASLTLIGPVIGGFAPAPEYARAFGEVIAAARGSTTVPADLARARQLWMDLDLFDSTRAHPAVRARIATMIERYDGHFLRTVGTPAAAELPLLPPAATRLADIAKPVQVIVGEHEIEFMRTMARALHTGVPGAELHTVPGGGHMVNMENPAPVNALIERFVARVQGA